MQQLFYWGELKTQMKSTHYCCGASGLCHRLILRNRMCTFLLVVRSRHILSRHLIHCRRRHLCPRRHRRLNRDLY